MEKTSWVATMGHAACLRRNKSIFPSVISYRGSNRSPQTKKLSIIDPSTLKTDAIYSFILLRWFEKWFFVDVASCPRSKSLTQCMAPNVREMQNIYYSGPYMSSTTLFSFHISSSSLSIGKGSMAVAVVGRNMRLLQYLLELIDRLRPI